MKFIPWCQVNTSMLYLDNAWNNCNNTFSLVLLSVESPVNKCGRRCFTHVLNFETNDLRCDINWIVKLYRCKYTVVKTSLCFTMGQCYNKLMRIDDFVFSFYIFRHQVNVESANGKLSSLDWSLNTLFVSILDTSTLE